MADFFNQVKIATPWPNATVASPVHIQASTSGSMVFAMQLYVDHVLKCQTNVNSIDTKHTLLCDETPIWLKVGI